MKEDRLDPEAKASAGASNSSPITALSLLLTLGPVLLVAIGCEKILLKLTRLPENAYGSSVLFWQVGQQSTPLSVLTLVAVLSSLLAFFSPRIRRRLLISWPELCSGREIRWLIALAAFPLVWRLTTHDHNYYWDQSYPIDRLLIGLCFLFLLFRPIGVAPLILVSLPVLFQIDYPLRGATWTTSSMSVHIQIFFLAYLVVVVASRSRLKNDRILFWGLLLVLCIHYWPSGREKLASGWLFHDQIHVLFSATTSAGWLRAIDQEQLDRFARILASYDLPIRLGTLVIELSPLLFLWCRRSLALLLLIGFASFHVGVVLLTGIFFWEWILIELGWALTLLYFATRQTEWPPLTVTAKLAGSILIGTSTLWYQAPALFWFDAAASYSYEFQARDQDGNKRILPQNFFEPTSYEVRLQNLDYLVPDTAQLKVTFGATDRETSQLLLATKTPEDLLALEQRIGTVQFDQAKVDRFGIFVQRYISNYNRRPELKHAWATFSAPYCLLEYYPSDISPPKFIDQIEIFERLTFFDGNKTHVARRQLITTIDIKKTP